MSKKGIISKKDKYLICKFCGNSFIAYKQLSVRGYTQYNMAAKFCSKSCAAKSNKEQYSKEDINRRISFCMHYYQEYCNKERILDYIGISSKTFVKLGFSVKQINSSFGFYNKKDYFETQVYKWLLTKFSKHEIEREKTFDAMVDKGKLRLDFYIKHKNLAIEADGLHHTNLDHTYFTLESKHRDHLKEAFLLKNNIQLIRIPYVRKLSIEYLNSFLPDIDNQQERN